jgi:hypothetical protein
MTNLNFYGPFHFYNADSKGKLKSNNQYLPNPNSHGIYIWGFMYYFDKTTKILGEPVNFNGSNITYNEQTMQFIPYYVGKKEAGKNGKGTIYQRIKQHHNIRKGDATKYIRLSKNYMKDFFKDNNFPLKIKRVKNNSVAAHLICTSPGKIEYFNDPNCLKLIHPNITLKPSGRNKSDYPITDQKIGTNDLPDTLSYLINTLNNFWFCYSIPQNQNPTNSLEDLETYTFWSLKGLTISQTACCPMNNPNIAIACAKANIFKISPSNQFNGY